MNQLFKNFFNVGAMTLLSRLLGFVRDILMASVLGTGLAADAFFAAFRFPNLFRRLFAEGAFNAAFIPLFVGELEQSGEEQAKIFAGRILSWLAGFLVVLTVLAEIFMPQVVSAFVPGFLDDPEKFELTVFLTRICFPYLACMSLMSAYGGILNGLGKFLAAAFAPVLLNIVLVAILGVLVVWARKFGVDAVMWVAIGTLIGGVAQLALVVWAVKKTGFWPTLHWPKFDRDVRRFWMLALPTIAAGGVTQINIFIGTIIASGADSAISYLYYADRLYQLPLGIIGIAIGVVLLPELARHLKAGRDDEARQAQDQSLFLAMVLSLPAAAGLVGLAEPIISILFERGAFSAFATSQTASALVWFALGLPAFILIKLFQPGFFAREDTLTPTLLAALSVAINIALSLFLFPRIGHMGIAIATSVAAWVNALALSIILSTRGHFALSLGQAGRYLLLVALAVGLGTGLWGASIWGADLLGHTNILIKAAALLVTIVVGMLAYFAALHVTGLARLGQFIAMFRRAK